MTDGASRREPSRETAAGAARARAGRALRRLTPDVLWVLPDFVIIGAQKGGTTSLYAHLSRHPNVLPARRKEVHFFDNKFARGAGWYRRQFPSVLTRVGRRLRHGAPVLAGEASPYYLFHPRAPERLRALLPGARLIVLLRNPVDRAYSQYWHRVRDGQETLSFEEALDREPERLAGEAERLRADPGYHSVNHQAYSYLARGVYVDQLVRWRALFPADRMLVLRGEDLFENPAKVYERVLRFLGLPDVRIETFEKRNAAPPYPPMADATRRRLLEYFRPHNLRLYDLLATDFGWDA